MVYFDSSRKASKSAVMLSLESSKTLNTVSREKLSTRISTNPETRFQNVRLNITAIYHKGRVPRRGFVHTRDAASFKTNSKLKAGNEGIALVACSNYTFRFPTAVPL